MNRISSKDITNAEILDRTELESTGSQVFLAGVTVTSTSSSTKQVVLSGVDIINDEDESIDTGDIVIITGTSGGLGDGTFSVDSIVNVTTFTVQESIGDSTGGSASFKYPSGATRLGLNSSGMSFTTATNVQGAMSDIDSILSEGGTVGRIIFKIDGGIVYDSNGHPLLKVNQ